jgi:hypothetical protein
MLHFAEGTQWEEVTHQWISAFEDFSYNLFMKRPREKCIPWLDVLQDTPLG